MLLCGGRIQVRVTRVQLLQYIAARELKAYAKAGAVAEQALRGIRTVQAFQGQEKEEQRWGDARVMFPLFWSKGRAMAFVQVRKVTVSRFMYPSKLERSLCDVPHSIQVRTVTV